MLVKPESLGINKTKLVLCAGEAGNLSEPKHQLPQRASDLSRKVW